MFFRAGFNFPCRERGQVGLWKAGGDVENW